MKRELLICDCASCEHQLIITTFDDDVDNFAYVEVHLRKHSFRKRLIAGLRYIFGYTCCYGNFEEIVLSPKHARQIYNLYRYLAKGNREKVSPQEFKEIVGDKPMMKAGEITIAPLNERKDEEIN